MDYYDDYEEPTQEEMEEMDKEYYEKQGLRDACLEKTHERNRQYKASVESREKR